MELILDTCGLLSLVGLTERRLSAAALRTIRSAEQLGVSVCTMFEIAIKHKKQGLEIGALAECGLRYSEVISRQSALLPERG